jgi:hypothetical protein
MLNTKTLYFCNLDKDNFDDINKNVELKTFSDYSKGFELNINNESRKLMFTTGFFNTKNLHVFTPMPGHQNPNKQIKTAIKMSYDKDNTIHQRLYYISKFLLELNSKKQTTNWCVRFPDPEIINGQSTINFKIKLDANSNFQKLYVLKDKKRILINNLSPADESCDFSFCFNRNDISGSCITATITSITVKYSPNHDHLKALNIVKAPYVTKKDLHTIKIQTNGQDIKDSNKIIMDLLNNNILKKDYLMINK